MTSDQSPTRDATQAKQYVPTRHGADSWQAHKDFPFEEIFASLDAANLAEVEELAPVELKKLSGALHAVLSWIVDAPIRKGYDAQLGRRAIALCWIVSPGLLKNSPSLRELANAMELNAGRTLLSRHAVAARRKFGISNQLQRHDWRN